MSTNFPAYPFCECTQWRLASESWKVQGTSNPPCKTGRLHEQRIYGRLGNHSWNLIGTCHLWPSEHGLLMASSTHQIILSHAIPCHPPTSPYCWLHFFQAVYLLPSYKHTKRCGKPTMSISFSQWEPMGFPHIFLYVYPRVGLPFSSLALCQGPKRAEAASPAWGPIHPVRGRQLISDNMAWRHYPSITLYIIWSKEVSKSYFRLMDRCSNSGESSQRRERVRRERVSRKKSKVSRPAKK